jgi:hypothetical protein
MKKKKKDSIDHLDDIDVVFDPTPLTREQEIFLSDFIRKLKEKEMRSKKTKKRKQAA